MKLRRMFAASALMLGLAATGYADDNQGGNNQGDNSQGDNSQGGGSQGGLQANVVAAPELDPSALGAGLAAASFGVMLFRRKKGVTR